MKIRAITALPVNIPFRAPYRFSYGSIASLTKTVIQLETEDGVIGLGECADGDRAMDAMAMGARLIGHDLREVGTAEAKVVPGMHYTPWGNVMGARRVFAGIEMAMWDARGKTEGVSLATLLGGVRRDRIELSEYFSYRWPGIDAGESSPTEVAHYCAAMIEKHGSTRFEGKMGTVDLSEEVRMVAEVRAAIGDLPLQLDANGTWTVPTARDALRRVAPYDIAWFEEPCESYDEMAQLRRHCDIPFSAHSIDLSRAHALGCPEAVVTNINEHGGIARTVDFIRAAELLNVGFRFHSGETGIASAAYLHLTAALEHVRDPSQTLFHWYADDVIEGGPHRHEGGFVALPQGPGLGVTLDPAAIARCHQRYLDEGSFPDGRKAGYGGQFRKR